MRKDTFFYFHRFRIPGNCLSRTKSSLLQHDSVESRREVVRKTTLLFGCALAAQAAMAAWGTWAAWAGWATRAASASTDECKNAIIKSCKNIKRA